MHVLAQRSWLLLSALLLASCSPLAPSVLLASTMLELAPGETIHVVLTLNAAAVVQADMGLALFVDANADGAPRLDVVPDDPSLEPLVSTGSVAMTGDGVRMVAQLEGGDLATLCPSEGECEVGVTLAMSGNETPASLAVRFGARRDSDRGLFGGSSDFDERATASLTLE